VAARETGGRPTVADVTREADLARVFTEAGGLFGASFAGVVDIVGRADLRPIIEFSETEWDSQFSLILKHAFFTIKHAAPHFPSAGGTMVFVSSLETVSNLGVV